MARIIVIGTLPSSLVNFRGALIRAMVDAGHEVIAMADPSDGSIAAAIAGMGARFIAFPVQRSGLNPLRDLATYRALRQVFREVRPDVVFAYTIKPVIWGGFAIRGQSQCRFYALITGLGFAFQRGGILKRALNRLVTGLYCVSLRCASGVIFQNRDNQETFVSLGIVPREVCSVVDGSGIDLQQFTAAPLPPGEPVFLLIARFLREKGLREYAAAACSVKIRYPTATFRLLGPPDPSPDGIPLKEVQGWNEQGAIENLGAAKDVRPYLAKCHVYVLPSYHEGMPRTVLEAMAVGRPILSTDVPGCRETVVPGENGFLVPKGDADCLAERMIWFIEHRDQWQRMGQHSRRLAEERFGIEKVNSQLFQIMDLAVTSTVAR